MVCFKKYVVTLNPTMSLMIWDFDICRW
jgi:hypothetical protein